MEIIIGIIDDDLTQSSNYKDILEGTEIKVKIYHDDFEGNRILEWIVENKIDCLIIDYKLVDKARILGTELIYWIENTISNFPCVLLTSYPEDANSKNIVNEAFVFDKKVMEDEGEVFQSFINRIGHLIKVFRERMKIKEREYIALLDKKREDIVSSTENERFTELHKTLRAYGIIDEIPADLIGLNIEKRIDCLIERIDKLTQEK